MKTPIYIPRETLLAIQREVLTEPPAAASGTIVEWWDWLKARTGKDISKDTARAAAKDLGLTLKLSRPCGANPANRGRAMLVARKLERVCAHLGIEREDWWHALLNGAPMDKVNEMYAADVRGGE